MKKYLKKNIALLAILVVINILVYTVYAESESKFADGIEGVSVNRQGTESTVTVTISDDAKLLGDVVLIAVAYDKTTGKIAAIDSATYKKV